MDIMKREELLHVLNTLGCEPEDVTVLLQAFDRLQAHPEARAAFDEACALYRAAPPHDHAEMLRLAETAARHSGVHEYAAEFLLYACLSDTLLSRYRERGLSDTLFWNTLQDLRYKLDECMLVYGIVGSFVASWFNGFFTLERFGMGRLQFEIIPFKYEYHKNGVHLEKNANVINVHIPRSGEPLTEESCREAYLLAKDFLGDKVQTEPCPFVCHSWLLYPTFGELLNHKSNTYLFYKSFEIIDTDIDKTGKNLWRLFDTMERHPDRLPANTTMRRVVVEHLKKGGKVGAAYGILFV
jgi:hypothetical protein